MPSIAKSIIKWILRAAILGICIFGVYIFIQRSFYEELFLLTAFKFFDYEKNVFVYLLETAAMSILFVSFAYYMKKLGLTIKNVRQKTANQ